MIPIYWLTSPSTADAFTNDYTRQSDWSVGSVNYIE